MSGTSAPQSRWYTPAEPDDFATYDGPHEADPATLLPRAIAACVCGWHPSNHPGFWLADHLRDMNAGPVTGCGTHPAVRNPFCQTCRAHAKPGDHFAGDPD